MNTATFQETLTKARAKWGEIIAQRKSVWSKAQQDAVAAKANAATAEEQLAQQIIIDDATARIAKLDAAAKTIENDAKARDQRTRQRADAKAVRLAKLIEAQSKNNEARTTLQDPPKATPRPLFTYSERKAAQPPAPVEPEPPAPPVEEVVAPVEPEPPAPPVEEVVAPVEPPADPVP